MKKRILQTLIALLMLPLLSQAQLPNTWTRVADIGTNIANGPGKRANAVSFAIGGKGYVGTGEDDNTLLDDFWEYDTLANVWTQKANVPGGPRSAAIGMTIGNKGYIGTGTKATGYFTADFWEYDPAANTWTQKTDIGNGRNEGAAFSIGNKGYVGTGWGFPGVMLNDFWEYDVATDSWTLRDTLPGLLRYAATGFSVAGKGYMGTGIIPNGSLVKDMYEWNPATLTWTQKADFGGQARAQAGSFTIGNKAYMGLGEGLGYFGDLWEYNPVNDSWTQKANYNGGTRTKAVAMAIGNKGYAGIGFGGGVNMTDFWCYDPAVNSWSRKTNFGAATERYGSFGFAIGEKGYIGSGHSFSYYLNDFWEYDSQTNTWSQKADFTGGSRYLAATFTIGTKGYVSTGDHGTSGAYKDLYEYNPATNIWTQKSDFPGVARTRAVAFSIGNKGYLGTGYAPLTGIPTFLTKDFYEYDPATDTWTQKADFGGGYRASAMGFAVNGKGYIGTGESNIASNGTVYKNDFWEYNPVTNAWTQKSSVGPTVRLAANGFSVGSKGYMAVGAQGYAMPPLYDVWEYEPGNDTWTQKANFSGAPRTSASAFVIGNKGYIAAGRNDTSGVLMYDTWTFTTEYYIHTGTINGSPFCAGAPATVPFTKNGRFFAGNVFTAQLSDANGSFANPVAIGTLTDTAAGTIAATIPAGTPSGGGYRIRVVSSTPPIYGSDNGANIVVNGTIPVVTVTASPGNTVCQGVPVTYSATVFGGGANPAYEWKKNGVTVGTAATYTDNAPANNDAITCTVTSSATCVNTPATSAALMMTVIPVVTPVVTISAIPGDSVCEGTVISFSQATQNGGVTPSYIWKRNGSQVANTYFYNNLTPVNGDQVTVTLTSSAACATTPVVTDTMTIVVHPLPQPVITDNNNTLGTGPYAAYQWYFNGAPVSGATNASYVATQSGSYTVEVWSSDSCSNMSAPYMSHAGIDEVAGAAVHVFPNPVQDAVYVSTPLPVHLMLTDLTGRVLLYSKAAKMLDMKKLPAGVYFLKVLNTAGQLLHVARIVKEGN